MHTDGDRSGPGAVYETLQPQPMAVDMNASLLEDSLTYPTANSMSGLLGDFSWTFLGNGIFAGCQWGIIIILAKLVTTEVVGQYSLSQAIIGPSLMFTTFHLRGVVASDLKNQFTNREYFGFRIITLTIGLLLGMTVALLSVRSAIQLTMVALVGLTQAAELTSDTLYGFRQRRGDLVRPATSMILKGLCGLLALSASIYWLHSVLLGLAALFVTRAGFLLIYDFNGVMGERGSTLGLRREYFRLARHVQLLKVVFFLGLVAMLGSFIGMIPRYFVEGYLGPRELGVFAAISSLMAIGLMPVAALGMAGFVRLARAFADRASSDFLKLLSVLLGLSLIIGLGGVGLAYFAGPQILTTLFRHEYSGYTVLLKLTMVTSAVTYLTAALGSSLTAARVFKPQVTLLTVVGLTEFLACWLLVPRMGLTGAALACLGAAFVQFSGTALVLFTHLDR